MSGLFYAKKKRTQGPQKFTLALVIWSGNMLRQCRDFLTFASFLGLLLNRKLDRDNRSLLCYLSP